MSARERIRKALLASLFGWIAAWMIALPFQVVEVVRSSSVLVAKNLGIALAVWSALSFAMALYWCGFFLLPVAWLFSEARILRHRMLCMVGGAVFGAILMAVKLHVWTAADHDGVSLINYVMWAAYAGTFFFWTAAKYTRYLRISVNAPAAGNEPSASITL